MKNQVNKQNPTGTSLALRLILPTVLVITVSLVAVLFLGVRLSESLYNYQTVETLKNNLQLTQKALDDAWRNTRGAALRTKPILQQYTSQVFAGRLDFIGFHKQSGVVIIDSYSGDVIQAYPQDNLKLQQTDIQNILKETSSVFAVHKLLDNGFAVSSYFAPLGLHLIAFNKTSFEQTTFKKTQQILLISVFSVTAILLVSLMFLVVYISIRRPLQKMQKNMDTMIEKGNYQSSLNTDEGSKDVQELSKRFNTLIYDIAKRDKQIHQHATQLEHLVDERTKELKKAQKQLVLSERLAAIGEFASSVAHELRNPLSSIKMGVEKIAEIEGIEGNNKRRLTLIQSEVNRLSEMLSGILAFAAPKETKIKPLLLDNFIQELEHLVEGTLSETNHTLNIKNKPYKTWIQADLNKLRQVFINSIKNACEAAPENSEIIIQITHKKGDIIITITNQGQAIPKDVLNRLFEPFFTTKTKGTGLGLPISKRFMNEMSGDIMLKNSKSGIQTIITLKEFKNGKTS